MNDDAAFCPSCGAPNSSTPQSGGVPMGGGGFGGIDSADARKYLVRGIVGVAAVILAIVAIVFLVRLVSAIEGIITVFSAYDSVASGVGIAGFIVCGLLLTGCAVLAALPVARFALEYNSMGQIAIDRSIAFSIALLVLCIAVWICKLIFHSPVGGSVSGVLYNIFATFGETATGCLVPVIIAAAILYVVRTKLFTPAGVRY